MKKNTNHSRKKKSTGGDQQAEIIYLKRQIEIEASLEQVRSRTSAMQKSEELLEIVHVVRDELIGLGLAMDVMQIYENQKDRKQFKSWMAVPDAPYPTEIKFPFFEHPLPILMLKSRRYNKAYTQTFGRKEKNALYQKYFKVASVLPSASRQETLLNAPALTAVTKFLKNTGINVLRLGDQKFTHDDLSLIERFGQVFEQTYTRFLDLQKAEAQAREAKIEAALERVRAASMAMHQSEDLHQVVLAVSKEISNLGLNIDATHLYRFDDESFPGLKLWIAATGGTYAKEIRWPYLDHKFFNGIIEARKQHATFWSEQNNKREKNRLLRHLIKKTDIEIPEERQALILGAEGSAASMALCPNSGILILRYSIDEFNKEENNVLKRFGKVFEQSYIRFLDLKKAEAQAREAQIEASLERLRARTMAMHKSNELKEVAALMYEQMEPLQLAKHGCEIVLCDEENDQLQFWSTNAMQARLPERYDVPRFSHPFFRKQWKAWKQQQARLVITNEGKFKRDFDNFIFTKTDFRKFPDHVKKFIHSTKRDVFTHAIMKFGLLEAVDDEQLSEEKFQVLERFAKVFEQSYTRFLDLQKAEAQAREAKIEAALERVRAKTMAMHQSDELRSVISSIFRQLKELGFDTAGCSLVIYDDEDGDNTIWLSGFGNEIFPESYRAPYFDHPYLNAQRQAWKQGVAFKSFVWEGKLKKSVDEYYFRQTDYKNFAPEIKEAIINFGPTVLSNAFMSHGFLEIAGKEEIPDEQKAILIRFAKVFDQTYTRFLDIQKAEAQAKEAQIEAALERVRSRSLIMHKSNELQDVVAVVFEKLQELGFGLDGAAFIGIPVVGTKEIDIWIGDNEEPYPSCFRLAYYESPTIKDIWEAQSSGIDFISKVYPSKEKNHWFRYAFEQTPLKILTDQRKKWILEQAFLTQSFALAKNSLLGIHCHFEKVLSDDEIDILKRFSKVFEQGYVRFLDLQKAEAQTREAQIEAALERVRSKTMAMQSSEELIDVVVHLFESLDELGFDNTLCNLSLINRETRATDVWTAHRTSEGVSTYHVLIPYIDHPFYIGLMETFFEGIPFVVHPLSGDQKQSWSKVLLSQVDYSGAPKVVRKANEGMSDNKEPIVLSVATMQYGILVASRSDPVSPDEAEILQRFAKVFEQTYTRFLDLQKAEAQAREAQIQLALERVRARTMAMQHSDELSETSFLLAQQVRELGINAWGCAFHIYADADEDDYEWFSNEEGYLPFYKTPRKKFFKRFYEKRQSGETLYIEEFRGKNCAKHYEYLMSLPVVGDALKELQDSGVPLPTSQIDHVAYFSHGYLLFITYAHVPEAYHIFERFAKEFEQTYTRFLDLQKAEEQAREAQIETALERVRSSSMAMHRTDDLREVVKVLFEQMQGLSVEMDFGSVSIYIFNEGTRDLEQWLALPTGVELLHVPYFEHPILSELFVAKERGDNFFAQVFPVEVKNSWTEKGFELTDYKRLPDKFKAAILAAPGYSITMTLAKNSGIAIPSFDGKLLSDEDNEILKRIGRVFEQSYIRFLDLQKAEAQAREAQIEAALERVRSRTMGMQKSDELKVVIQLVLEQFVHLNINAEHAGFVIDYEAKNDWNLWIADPRGVPAQVTYPYLDSPWEKGFNEAKEKGQDFFAIELNFKEKNRFYRKLFKHIPELTKEAKDFYFRCPGLAASTVLLDDVALYAENFSGTPYSDEENAILMRFGKVFQQTYTRFLDLQKAEAQAREAHIEAALEKVRARTMAMHDSEELLDIIIVVAEQLEKLEIKFGNVSFGVNNPDYDLKIWMAVKGYPSAYEVQWSFLDNPGVTRLKQAQLQPEKVFSDELSQAENNEWMQHVFQNNPSLDIFSDKNKRRLLKTPGYARSIIVMKDIFLVMGNYALIPYTEEENNILKRFAKVFEQAYTRFLDLQKAEAQAREAQIEAALERVRAASMAMHQSDELINVATVMNEEFQKLGITQSLQAGFVLIDEEKKLQYLWGAQTNSKLLQFLILPLFGDQVFQDRYDAWKRKDPVFSTVLAGEALQKHLQVAMPDDQITERQKKSRTEMPDPSYFYFGNFKHGYLNIISTAALNDEHQNILARFAKVFEQTYTRFLDLKKAEEQAREAQIEGALERVRARTMAMHKSNELEQVVKELTNQFKNLRKETVTCWISLVNVETNSLEIWNNTGESTPKSNYTVNGIDYPTFQADIEAFKNKDSFRQFVLEKTVAKKVLKEQLQFELENTPEESSDYHLLQCRHLFGFMGYSSWRKADEKVFSLLHRFCKVFEQTYTRFLDLQKAEAQAREAQIEAALERVRSTAMTMQRSEELYQVVRELRKQMGLLGQKELELCVIHFYDKYDAYFESWGAIPTTEGDGHYFQGQARFPKTGIQIVEEMMTLHASEQSEYTIINEKEKAIEWFEALQQYSPDAFNAIIQLSKETKGLVPPKAYWSFADFDGGSLGMITYSPPEENSKSLLRRSASVFGLAYTRFLDLQKAEEQAKEARIEAALEKVRSASLSMQKTDDLQKVVDTVFEEMNKLDIGMDHTAFVTLIDGSKDYNVWVGSADANFTTFSRIPYNDWTQVQRDYNDLIANRPGLLVKQYEGEVKIEYSKYLFSRTGFKENTPEKELRLMMDGESLITSIAMMENTGIQIVSYKGKEFRDTENTILQRFSNVFEQAYIRFMDIQKSEIQAQKILEERNRLEKALDELKAAQAQLIHAEKMASLGELTAGIAHEIQNPLNFVNNFSDVSKELLEEAVEELENGDPKEVKEILNDLIQNLSKIHHHGDRASSIVKGMLAHSRSSSGEKTPTDINSLCDEYLRLAYHGMRAKDKSFNASFEADLDPSLPQIKIVPQDIGRVLLNLINNGFQAVTGMQKANGEKQKAPRVRVSTKTLGDQVQILVSDNGPGIPDEMKDKIFQPFFTTKPTGQGTGLGLSLSYDIVKAHGGDLQVQSKPGKGSEFSIILPLQSSTS